MNFETQMIIASNLRTLRISRQLTQAKVASFAGISRSLYAHYELGSRTQDAETLHTIAKAFEIDMDILFERDKDKFLSILASTPSTGSDKLCLYPYTSSFPLILKVPSWRKPSLCLKVTRSESPDVAPSSVWI